MLGGARLTNEAQYAWAKLAKGVLGTDNVDAQLDDGLPAEVVLGLPRATIDEACRPGGTIILCGPDPKEELGSLFLRLRHAVVHDGATLIEMTPSASGLATVAAHTLHPRPGEVGLLAPGRGRRGTGGAAVEAAGVDADAIASAAAAVDGPVTVVLGRASLAESSAAVVDAALALAELDEVGFLSALRRGNVHGALDNGLAPGLLPGRATLESASDRFADAWPRVPGGRGLDAGGILERAAAGDLDVLVLLGADPQNDFPDRSLATSALDEVETVIAVDVLLNDSVDVAADVVLAAAGPTETSGTFTNLEGRVSVVEQKVTPPGTARADWMIAAELARRLGTDLGVRSPEEIRAELVALSAVHAPLTEENLAAGRVDGVVIPGAGEITPPASGSDTLPANDAYSLRLVTRRTMYDDGVALRHSPSSRGLAGPFEVRLHPADFAKIGVEAGSVVRLVSGRDQVMAPARPDAGVPEGSAVVPWLAPGSAANALIDRDAMVTDVRVERS